MEKEEEEALSRLMGEPAIYEALKLCDPNSWTKEDLASYYEIEVANLKTQGGLDSQAKKLVNLAAEMISHGLDDTVVCTVTGLSAKNVELL